MIVYTGPGSSNSWIWLADFLEGQGFLATKFVPDPGDVISSPDDSILIIPGGDTFRIAGAFGERGLAALSDKICDGMGYLGICAGAYLPLRSSIPPLSSFNIMSSRISNISSRIPKSMAEPDRYSTRYGCSYVFHPARGPMELSGDADLIAPLYGGPFLSPSDGERVRLTFSGVTADTELLVDIDAFDEMSKGKAACIEGRFGKGRILAIAPHLEHPDYPDANAYLRDLILGFDSGTSEDRPIEEGTMESKEIRSALADLRVLASALDNRSWKVGVKYWEGDKLLFYIDAMRRRLTASGVGSAAPSDVLAPLLMAKNDLKALQSGDCESALESAVENLSKAASLFLTSHFSRLYEDLTHDRADG